MVGIIGKKFTIIVNICEMVYGWLYSRLMKLGSISSVWTYFLKFTAAMEQIGDSTVFQDSFGKWIHHDCDVWDNITNNETITKQLKKNASVIRITVSPLTERTALRVLMTVWSQEEFFFFLPRRALVVQVILLNHPTLSVRISSRRKARWKLSSKNLENRSMHYVRTYRLLTMFNRFIN